MKPPTFPFPVKRGSATVTIYRSATHGYESFIVYYKSAGRTHRKTFPDFPSAKEEAWTKAGQLDCGDGAALSMSSEDRASFLRARQLLNPSGVSLEVAAGQFAEAHKILGGLSLIDAARLVAKMHSVKKPNITVGEVATELLADRAKSVCREHLRVLGLMLNRVSRAFDGMRMGSIDGPLLKAFLDMAWKPRHAHATITAPSLASWLISRNFRDMWRGTLKAVRRIQEYKGNTGQY